MEYVSDALRNALSAMSGDDILEEHTEWKEDKYIVAGDIFIDEYGNKNVVDSTLTINNKHVVVAHKIPVGKSKWFTEDEYRVIVK